MGSRSNVDYAYIAGFLDGDGSLMLQIKRRLDCKRGFRFMATICFYQDSRHKKPLYWIKKVLNIGYLTDRSDGMSELRINGFSQVSGILRLLSPYLRFKAKQAKTMQEALALLTSQPVNQLAPKELEKLVNFIITIRNCNYKSYQRNSKELLRKTLGLTP